MTFEEIEHSIKQNPILEDLEDSRDYQFEEIMGDSSESIPENFSLRGQMTKVKTQGRRGTCVGFSAVGIAEHYNSLEHKKQLNLSEEYTFKRIKEIDIADYNYTGYGAYLRSGAKALQKYGSCLEKTAPYNFSGSETAWKDFVVSPEMTNEGKLYKMQSYARVSRTKEGIKKALYLTKSPLLAGITLWKSYRQAKKNGGYIPRYTSGDERVGGHAMIIVGYTKDHVIWKNSWGSQWGDEGYVYTRWDDIDQMYATVWSFVDEVTNEEAIIEANKKMLLPHQVEAWNKAIAKGIVTTGSIPSHGLTKGDFMVFVDRLGLLE